MARKRKQRNDPNQLSLFDIIVDTIEEIQEDKAQADKQDEQKGSIHARQSNTTVGNSPKSPPTPNNRTGTPSRLLQLSLFDTRPMGTEQPRQAERAGSIGGRELSELNSDPRPTEHHRTQDTVQRHSVGNEPEGDVRLGDITSVRDRYRVENYQITNNDRLGEGGAKVKYADNIAAIRLLHHLQTVGAQEASPEEKAVLVRYVGWGGLSQAFDSNNEQWSAEYQELQQLFTPDDYAKARRTTQDAHFTSENVIRGMYDGLAHLGLTHETSVKRVLEPSAGIGNFIGLCPANFNAKFLTVEQDPTTAAITQFLYPEAQHHNMGFQHANISASSFDVVVGNPPFGKQALFDPEFPELRRFSIHNYFLAKSLNVLREGGVGAFVVSRYFLDAQDSTAREHIAQYADMLGAIRLPDSAFRQNALTDVTSDIVFFQKNTSEHKLSQDWVQTQEIAIRDVRDESIKPAIINKYYADNPSQIIGEMVYSSGMFGNSVNCKSDIAPEQFTQAIQERLHVLPQNVYVPTVETEPKIEEKRDTNFIATKYFQSLKVGALCVEPRTQKIVTKTTGDFGQHSYDYATIKSDIAQQRIFFMIQIRDTLRSLLNEEKGQANEAKMSSLRKHLNQQYDMFTRRYGHLNSQTNRALMRTDPEHSLVESLEHEYDKGVSKETAKKQGREARPASAKKAAIFSKRVLKPAETVEHADTPKDALIIALRETGRVDFSRMSKLCNRPPADIQEDLQKQGLIYRNPRDEQWEIRDKYLTGNVRQKLHIAKAKTLQDDTYQVNVEALEKALPADIEAIDIGIRFGASWVPGNVFEEFIEERITQGNGNQHIQYIEALGKWDAKIDVWDNAVANSVWGIPEYPANKICESLLKNTPIRVMKDSGQLDEQGKPIKVVDQELTAAAMQKAHEVKQAFVDWVWTDDDRRVELSRLYNERFNTNVPPRYDGSLLELGATSSDITLRPHQKDAVWRGIQEGTGLFDHVVGAGKTMACIATIMESKRMGFVNKPMVVVPNHLLHQWRDEFYTLYPDANILVADKDDFTKQNRERLFSRIATGDWDAVVVAHSSFGKIDMPYDMQQEILKEQIAAVVDAISDLTVQGNSRSSTVKQLEKQKEKMQERYKALLASGGKKDTAVDFGDLGVDALFVDESHEFKNLAFATTMNVSGLGNIAGSAKALDLFIKCRYLQKKHEGRGVYFLTGTPISNTIAEVYTLQRYMQYDSLQDKGIAGFDAWASTFGEVTANWELDATGVNYKLKSRFASFQNVPELLAMYRTFADVVTKSDLDEQSKNAGLKPFTPPLEGGKPHNHIAERSTEQSQYMDIIIKRMENLPKDPRIDNPLKVTNDARKCGLDYRLIDPDAEDCPHSKSNQAVAKIYDIWNDTKEGRGTQLVFCDLSTPKGSAGSVQKPKSIQFENDMAEVDKDTAVPPLAHETTQENTTEETVVMDDVLAQSSRFSVYHDMRQKLLERGVPAEEIAFIHDANTDVRKSKLFADMNAGRVRILLGSTSKMGAGMNVQKRLVAAHHLDAPWRPSDLEQRNGRIIRQGNNFYKADPENFKVGIHYYATKQTYDSRMWQTIEYKAAAIEQFRKGDVLQRTIEDVQSEAANAAEMKAAASGNPLILLQVQLASDLRKLEALYSQHQRSQHRMRDSLNVLATVGERLIKRENDHILDTTHKERNTHKYTEKGKEKLRLEFFNGGNMYTDKDSETLKNFIVDGVKEAMKTGKSPEIGRYRGFTICARARMGADNFSFSLKGASTIEYVPDNLIYSFEDKLSLSGFFQRLDNFLDKGMDESVERYRQNCAKERTEMDTIKASIDKPFSQQAELVLVRENHSAVMRELQRMQDDTDYVSEWTPKEKLETNIELQEETTQQRMAGTLK